MAKNSSSGKAWEAVRQRAYERDGGICVYCGVMVTKDVGKPTSHQGDHIIPKDAGGSDELHNVVTSCFRCNRNKSNRILQRLPYVNKRWLDHI